MAHRRSLIRICGAHGLLRKPAETWTDQRKQASAEVGGGGRGRESGTWTNSLRRVILWKGRMRKEEREGKKSQGWREREEKGRAEFPERPGEMKEITAAEPLPSFLFNLSLDVLLVKSLQRPFIFKIERQSK